MEFDWQRSERMASNEERMVKGLTMKGASDLLDRVTLQEDELDYLVWEDEIDTLEIGPKWLALGHLLTTKPFSQSALS